MKINWNNKYATISIYAFLVICGSILLYLGISQINEIKLVISDFIGTLQPFIIGGALAYILNFILKFYEEYVLSYKWFKNLKKNGTGHNTQHQVCLQSGQKTHCFLLFIAAKVSGVLHISF